MRLAILFAWLGSSVFAGQLVGKVVDSSGEPIPGAGVQVVPAGVFKVSARDGSFQFDLPEGTYTVLVDFLGFKKIEESGVVIGPGHTELTLTMYPEQFEQITVVSASKVETKLIDSPATISVITADAIENSAADDYGDLLRTVPGVNVIQFSARDINVVSRQTASSLSNSQLTLLDGRSIYQDFYGIVLWDLVPTDMSEIKQIEVIRGPASAVWGANAQTGVTNIITKSPHEIQGTSFQVSGSIFSRDVEGNDLSDGAGFGFNVTHAGLIRDNMAYKVSAGYFEQDAYARPLGIVPRDDTRGTGGFEYPEFKNQGTSQPKLDFRLDQNLSNGGKLVYGAGAAGTEGMIHTGIGPFDIQNSSYLAYTKVNYSKGAFKANFFINYLDGDAKNVLARDAETGDLVEFNFKNRTTDFELGHAKYLGEHHLLSYGGNYRLNQFELSLAPEDDERKEYGLYLQDEMSYGWFRMVLGARYDKFDVIEDPVVSPRVTMMVQPNDKHTFRASYNKAFRSPSMVENFLNISIVSVDLQIADLESVLGVDLPGESFPVVSYAYGNPNLTEDRLEAYELSYTGAVGNGLVSFSWYRNDTEDNINFVPFSSYSSNRPPPGWTESGLPVAILDVLEAGGVVLPAEFSYFNLGPLRYEGYEFSLDYKVNEAFDFNFNYSFQDTPEILPAPEGEQYLEEELSIPPENRINLTLNYNRDKFNANMNASYVDDAFWTDVLDSRYHGPTDSFTLVNLSLSYEWMPELTTMLKVNNLTDEEIQHHVFGDVLRRQIAGELKYRF
ncbi:MAG: TonB-dependent receptor [Acidobacteria bacterium]|nr:TonB-dependent receptor [Acidobacteriota bacterium]